MKFSIFCNSANQDSHQGHLTQFQQTIVERPFHPSLDPPGQAASEKIIFKVFFFFLQYFPFLQITTKIAAGVLRDHPKPFHQTLV